MHQLRLKSLKQLSIGLFAEVELFEKQYFNETVLGITYCILNHGIYVVNKKINILRIDQCRKSILKSSLQKLWYYFRTA